MTCNCKNTDELRIVRGNAFAIRLTVSAVHIDGTPVENFVLGDSEAVLKVMHLDEKTSKDFLIIGNDAIISFGGDLSLGWYGFEMTGTFNGRPWRWCVTQVFQVVETSAKANIPAWAVLTDETYSINGVMTITSGDIYQSDWDETDPQSPSYIKNKPTKLADFNQDSTHRVVSDEQIAAWNAKYDKPTGGIPKSDLAQSVQESLDDADSAYQKPSGGIPATDLAGDIPENKLDQSTQEKIDAGNSAYQLPSGGIPKSDLAQSVQESLDDADSAYQKPSGGIPATDLAGDIPESKLDQSTQEKIDAGNSAYQLPSGGIPKSDLAQSVQESLDDADSAYQKPSGGIPATDLAGDIPESKLDQSTQEKIDAGNSAYQLPSGGIPKSDLDSSVQTSLGKADTAIQDVTQIENDIDNIEKLIPQQATEQNQLADKQFVNSSISTATATYRGSYNLVSDLELTTSATEQQIAAALATKMAALSITPDNNDYCFVQVPTADATPTEIARVDRYKFNGTAWVFEFSLNNSGFTAAQWAALNSGITSGLVTKLGDLPTNSELTILLNGKQDTISDGAQVGMGYGICSTAAATAAKTASISNFILLKNVPVSVKFESAISVDSATLNINSTGAKPIFIQGAALQPGVVKAKDVVTLIYDGTNWNIVEILSVHVSPSDLYVDMGLPSGTLWAKANIDATTQSGFAEVDGKPSPFKYECTFFSWGNTDGHNPVNGSFDISFDAETYASTPGATLTADAGLSFDAARAILGAPWRTPTSAEFTELFDNCDFIDANGDVISGSDKTCVVNSVNGIRLRSKSNGNVLFIPICGYANGSQVESAGGYGCLWQSGLYSSTQGRRTTYFWGGINSQSYETRYIGLPIRPVQ